MKNMIQLIGPGFDHSPISWEKWEIIKNHVLAIQQETGVLVQISNFSIGENIEFQPSKIMPGDTKPDEVHSR